MSEKENKNKKLGILITGFFHVVVVLLLFAFTMETKEKEDEPVILIMDFTSGSSSRGGSASEANPSKNTPEEQTSTEDPVITQDKSPVKKPNKPKRKPKPGTTAGKTFGGINGKGKVEGEGNDENEGLGGGEYGPNVSGKTGELGKEEGIAPKVENPTNDREGKVVIELTVNRKGEVVGVKVLSPHAESTTSDPLLETQAIKDGYRFKFKANNKRAKLAKGIRVFNYVLR